MKFTLYLILFTLSFISHEALAKNCQEVRMSLDIGSGSTKMMVAKVDFCERKILQVLAQDSRPVSYNEDLEKSTDSKLSAAIADKGYKALTELIAQGKTFKPKKSYGVATSVFRKADNGSDVIKTFARKSGIRLEVVSQEDEALLGYLSVLSLLPQDQKAKNIVVWDIGGGSMQMFSQDGNRMPHRYLGDLASVTFKNMIIEVIQQKNIETTTTPNPIGDKRDQIIALARSYSKLHVPVTIKNELKDHIVVGVGGVHSQSIKKQLDLKGMKYTLEELDKASKIQVQKSDKDLAGDYRTTDVSNLLLVQGFMEGLGIKEVEIVNATLVQGALLK